MLKMSVRWLKNEPPHELEFEGVSDEVLRTRTGASSVAGVPKRYHSPKDLVAIGIAGCTGVDVVSILKKMRQPLEELAIETELTQTDDHPRVFQSCTLTYKFFGEGLETDRVLRAAALSFGKYCGVSAMIKRSGCHFEPRLMLNGTDLSGEFREVLLTLEGESGSETGSQERVVKKAALLITGNELLVGKTSDTNGRFIIKELTKLGIQVDELRMIGDDRTSLVNHLRTLSEKHDFIFMTGGLGPTKDDLTSEVVAEAFNLSLDFSEVAWDICQRAFKLIGRSEIPESNRKQALLPSGAGVLANSYGTAAGFFVQHQTPQSSCTIFALPGVPWECEEMFHNQVKEKLAGVGRKYAEWGPWHIWGIGESALQTQFSVVEKELLLKKSNIVISYQAHAGYISYGFKIPQTTLQNESVSSDDELRSEIDHIEALMGMRLLYKGSQTLVERLREGLSKIGASVALAESCTGGRIASDLTAQAGISSVFNGGTVAYSNDSKKKLLNVSASTLDRFGAVSIETAIEMALGAKAAFSSSIALSVSGVAGPEGGSVEKPVGTVCFSLAIGELSGLDHCADKLLDVLALQGWGKSDWKPQAGTLVYSVEKKFGQHLSRELIQKRANVFAQCSLVAVAEVLRSQGA